MTRTYAIDPGPTESALVGLDSGGHVFVRVHEPNEEILARLTRHRRVIEYDPRSETDELAIEWIHSWGMPAGQQIFDTCFWCGRFAQAWTGRVRLIKATLVRHHLCNATTAKKGNVRQALIDKFPATGGGARPVIGTKKQPGPLYGFSKHLWSALAVGVAARENSNL